MGCWTRMAMAVLVGAAAGAAVRAAGAEATADGAALKTVLDGQQAGENLLKPEGWRPYEKGFQRSGPWFVCDNAGDTDAHRGLNQSVELNQTTPAPIVATVWSKAEGVTGSPGQRLRALPGPDLRRRHAAVGPDRSVCRGHARLAAAAGGRAAREAGQAAERSLAVPAVTAARRGSAIRNCAWSRRRGSRAVRRRARGRATRAAAEGFQIRDVAAGSDFVRIDQEALGVKLDWTGRPSRPTRTFFDVTLADTTGKDRAVTLVYAIPVDRPPVCAGWQDPRRSEAVAAAPRVHGRQPLPRGRQRPAVALPAGGRGRRRRAAWALGIDMAGRPSTAWATTPASGELFLAYDLGLAPEKPSARLRFCRFAFDPDWGFRAALAAVLRALPGGVSSAARRSRGCGCRSPRSAKSKDWQDFGFKFKEGNDETAWDDQHGIITFRYTEPMTWWMRMPKDMPRTHGGGAGGGQAAGRAGETTTPRRC